MNKDERIKKEIRKLKRIFKDLPKDKSAIVEKLIGNAAFMAATLEDLQDAINQNGCISTYQNGENQWGTKKSPEADLYNTMIKNYSTVVKQLTDMLPKDEAKAAEDELVTFIQKAVR
jgi:hypothetical protein